MSNRQTKPINNLCAHTFSSAGSIVAWATVSILKYLNTCLFDKCICARCFFYKFFRRFRHLRLSCLYPTKCTFFPPSSSSFVIDLYIYIFLWHPYKSMNHGCTGHRMFGMSSASEQMFGVLFLPVGAICLFFSWKTFCFDFFVVFFFFIRF